MEHETVFREFADSTPVMMWRTDARARHTYFNASWLDFTGRAHASEAGGGWRDGQHPDDRGVHLGLFEAAFARREPFTMEYRLRRHDGVFRWVQETGRPLDRGGEFVGYFGSCIDVTAGKEAEAEIARGLAEKETLLAEVYHRVRNNLQIMVSLIGFYGRAAPEGCRPAFVALMQRVRAIALVQQHLHETSEITAIDARDYLERLAVGFMHLSREASVAVLADDAVLPAIAPRTANALGMVVAEIVSECLEALLPPGPCEVSIALEPRGADAIGVAITARSGRAPRGATTDAPPLGRRLIEAYAAQAGIEIVGRGEAATDGGPDAPEVLRLLVPVGFDAAPVALASS